MSERPKLQLENEGDEAVMLVKYVNEVKTKFGAKLVFVGEVHGREAETPLIPDTTADKQLGRLNLTRQSAVGETLKFSRSPNPSGKAYWNIDLAGMGDNAPKPTGRRLPPPDAPPSRGKLPFDDESFPNEEYGTSVHSPEPDAYADPRPLPAFHKPPTKAAETAPLAEQKAQRARQYLDLLAWVQAETKLAPEVAQPVAATIWIDWKQAGLVK